MASQEKGSTFLLAVLDIFNGHFKNRTRYPVEKQDHSTFQ